MNLSLTKQQQVVLCAVVFLFFTGLAVRAWRLARPAPSAAPVPATDVVR